MLRETPAEARTGFVFNPRQAHRKSRPGVDASTRTIVKIGRASGVQTLADREGSASAHDLRRSLCYRWVQRVLPQVLRHLAPHSDVATTLTYYAEADAAMTFDAVWEAVEAGSTFKIADTGVSAGRGLAT